ncbi:uncharacterized protein LOC143576926 [Bidens hawaiensis]|uniref:uncharacterized protein LOC143576926 n=1 Tax=Bidens hawaiensis TaxID=980011 RepID=UPI0040493DCD
MGNTLKPAKGSVSSNPTTLQCPMLTSKNYTIWAMRTRAIFNVYGMWDAIELGIGVDAKIDNIAIALLFQSIPEEQIMQVGNLGSAEEMWEVINTRHLGIERVWEARLQTLLLELYPLKMKDSSSVDDFMSNLLGISSKATSLGSTIEETRLAKKFLNWLPKQFIQMVDSIEQMVDLKTFGFDDVVGRLKAYEERIREEQTQNNNQGDLMISRNGPFYLNQNMYKGRGKNWDDKNQDGCENRGGQNRGSSQKGQRRINDRQRGRKDRSHVQCYRCDEFSYFASMFPKCMKKKEKRE